MVTQHDTLLPGHFWSTADVHMDRRGGYSESPISATVFNDGACNNEFVIHYEGTTDGAQQSWDRPRSIRDRRIIYGTTLAEACGRRYFENQLCHSSRLCGAGRASLTKEDTAKPVVSEAIFPNFINQDSSSRLTRMTTTPSTLTSTPTPSFQTRSTSSGERIQTKLMPATTRSGRSWSA